MKNFVYLLLISFLFASCSEYQNVLNKGTIPDQYKMAEKLYEEGKYTKALTLFERVTPAFSGKPQLQRIQFMVANSNYMTKNYELASYYFNRFINNYPNSTKLEEANFLVAQSYYKFSPVFSLDQKNSQKALNSLQAFIDRYPESDKVTQVNEQYQDLTVKLERKAFEIAKQYYKIGQYQAAITSLDNFISDFLGTKFKEDALFYKFKSGNDLALKSVYYKKEKRINNALKYYKRFKKYYPESKFISESDNMVEKLNKELETINLANSK